MSGEFIQIDAGNGQTFSAYMAKPRQGSGPGLILLQEIFGIPAERIILWGMLV